MSHLHAFDHTLPSTWNAVFSPPPLPFVYLNPIIDWFGCHLLGEAFHDSYISSSKIISSTLLPNSESLSKAPRQKVIKGRAHDFTRQLALYCAQSKPLLILSLSVPVSPAFLWMVVKIVPIWSFKMNEELEVGSLTEKFPWQVLERWNLALNFQILGAFGRWVGWVEMMMRKDRAYQQAIGHFLLAVISELSNLIFLNPLPVTHRCFKETFRMPVNFKKGKAWVEAGCSLW